MSDTLKAQLVELEARITEVKRLLKEKENDPTTMPIGTVVIVDGLGEGVEAITKTADGVWFGVYLQNKHSRTEDLVDEQVKGILMNDSLHPRVHRS